MKIISVVMFLVCSAITGYLLDSYIKHPVSVLMIWAFLVFGVGVINLIIWIMLNRSK
jgi:biotin transporter BioY